MNRDDKKHYRDQKRAGSARFRHGSLATVSLTGAGASSGLAGASAMKLWDLFSASSVELNDEQGQATVKLTNPTGSDELISVLDAQGLCHDVYGVNTCSNVDLGLTLAAAFAGAVLLSRFGVKSLKRSVVAGVREQSLSPTHK